MRPSTLTGSAAPTTSTPTTGRRWAARRPGSPAPEQSVIAVEIRGLLAAGLQQLPERQRTVVTLRDVHGMTADEVCSALDMSPANQRVLLHRGRAKLRSVLEDYYRSREGAS